MKPSRVVSLLAGVALATLVAVAVAGCGGHSATAGTHSTRATSGTAQATSSTATKPASMGMLDVTNTSLGKILVDSQGRTLYLFRADDGSKSACSGPCATAWPPLVVHGKPSVGTGLSASLVATSKRSDGTRQVTYNGHPLYLYIQDQKPGDVNGQGLVAFGAAWYALSPSGNQTTSHPSTAAPGGSSSGY